MELIDAARICLFHKAQIQDFGEGTVEALGWKSEQSQVERFKVLAQIGNMNNRSVLDVGCGHGDLKAFLDKQYRGIHYSGIDQMASFLHIACKRFGELPYTTFYLGDYTTAELPVADYVLICGALSYCNSDPDFIFKMIHKLFAGSQIALGFNLLGKTEQKGGLLMSYNSGIIMDYCKTLSANVELKEGYYEDDFTVFVYR